MELYFTDRKMNILGMASDELPEAIYFYETHETEEINVAVTLLSGYVNKTSESSQFCKVGNYILYLNDKAQAKFLTIVNTIIDKKDKSIYFEAEDAGLEMLGEIAEAYEADKAYPIKDYVERFAIKPPHDTGFEIGINEISDRSRKLKWEGEDTLTKRLLSIANNFDCEISFSFDVQRMKVISKKIDIYKTRGNENNVPLVYGKEVDNIIIKESNENLGTAIKPTGGTPEGENSLPITLKGYKLTAEQSENGRYILDNETVCDTVANRIWSRYLLDRETTEGLGYITKTYSYDTLSQSELCNRSINKLKEIAQTEINYEVNVAIWPIELGIGDKVHIVDDDDELYLEARVLKLDKNLNTKEATVTLGDYLLVESGISQTLQDLADKIKTIKNGDTYYPWVRYADDDQGNGISAMPLNKKYMAIKYAKNQPTPSDDPNDYKGLWTLIKGSDGQQGIPGLPGADGQTKYMWIMYADTVTGSGMSSNPDGKMYIGVAFNQTDETPSNNPRDYNWSAMYDTEKLDEVINQVNSIVYPVSSPMEPENPKEGMQWWQTELNDDNNVIGYFVYKNGEWQSQTIQQAVLNIVSLNAVNITGSKITGTEIIGSSIQNTFTINDQGYTLTGTSTLENAKLNINYAVEETGQAGTTEIAPAYVGGSTYKADGTLQQSYQLSSDGLMLINGNDVGSLQAKSLVDNPWAYITLNSGFSWRGAPNNAYRPKVKKVYIQNKQAVRTAGIISSNNTMTGGTNYAIGTWNAKDFNVTREISITAANANTGGGAVVLLQPSGGVTAKSSGNWKEIRWDVFVGVED